MSGQISSTDLSVTERLAAIASRPVRPRDRDRAALHVLDWTGCAAIGAASPQAAILRAMLGETLGPCRVVGGAETVETHAALINGSLGNVLEMDDIHRRAILHPGPVVIPAALAAAEASLASPQALLDGVVRGYEAMVRVGAAVGPGHYRYWHNTSTCGPFGAAMAAGSVLGLGEEALVWALGNAGTQASGLWQVRHEEVMSKQLHAGHAAHAGLLAARLAAGGYTGPRTILEGEQGFFAATCPDGDPQAVVADPEAGWAIYDTSFKPWPACRHAHAAIDAALELRDRVSPDEVESIEVETYPDAIRFCDRPDPATVVQAKFSLQHSVAVTLLDGPPALAAFEPARFVATDVAALRRKVTVAEDTALAARYPEHYGARVSLRTGRGETLAAEVPDALGDPGNPLEESRIVAKAEALMAAAGLDAKATERLVAAVRELTEASDLVALRSAIPERVSA